MGLISLSGWSLYKHLSPGHTHVYALLRYLGQPERELFPPKYGTCGSKLSLPVSWIMTAVKLTNRFSTASPERAGSAACAAQRQTARKPELTAATREVRRCGADPTAPREALPWRPARREPLPGQRVWGKRCCLATEAPGTRRLWRVRRTAAGWGRGRELSWGRGGSGRRTWDRALNHEMGGQWISQGGRAGTGFCRMRWEHRGGVGPVLQGTGPSLGKAVYTHLYLSLLSPRCGAVRPEARSSLWPCESHRKSLPHLLFSWWRLKSERAYWARHFHVILQSRITSLWCLRTSYLLFLLQVTVLLINSRCTDQ